MLTAQLYQCIVCQVIHEYHEYENKSTTKFYILDLCLEVAFEKGVVALPRDERCGADCSAASMSFVKGVSKNVGRRDRTSEFDRSGSRLYNMRRATGETGLR